LGDLFCGLRGVPEELCELSLAPLALRLLVFALALALRFVDLERRGGLLLELWVIDHWLGQLLGAGRLSDPARGFEHETELNKLVERERRSRYLHAVEIARRSWIDEPIPLGHLVAAAELASVDGFDLELGRDGEPETFRDRLAPGLLELAVVSRFGARVLPEVDGALLGQAGHGAPPLVLISP
jgi:hypothetical protein